MKGTYKQFLELSRLVEKRSNEEAVEEYKETEDPAILAYLFISNYGILKRISNNFYLDETTKASLAVEMVHKSIKDYDEKKGRFTTLLGNYFSNRLKTEINNMNMHKRKASYYSDSLEKKLEDRENNIGGKINRKDSLMKDFKIENEEEGEIEKVEFIEDIKNREDLTVLEKNYCEILIEYCDNINKSDIAEKLNISNGMITYLNKNLKNKLAFI